MSCLARRDLLDDTSRPLAWVWEQPEVRDIVRQQQPDGSWRPSARAARGQVGRALVETYRELRRMVEQYQAACDHPAVRAAADFLLARQAPEGDIRGILGNQYAPYYTGSILYLLIKAGCEDARIDKGLAWLLDVRQSDGGWAPGSPGLLGLPGLTWAKICRLTSDPQAPTLAAFDPAKPFSAAATGMALRAFSVHPRHRLAPATQRAAELLKSKLLRRDNWTSYGHADNWVRFQFPFWWTNLVSALDTLSLIGLPATDPDVARGLAWLVEHQQSSGLWAVSYSKIHKAPVGDKARVAGLWVSLAICRIIRRFDTV